MEYIQERIATFHDFGDAHPGAPVDRATVVVPLAQRDYDTRAANRVMEQLERVDPGRVLVPLRAEESAVVSIVEWIESFAFDGSVLWCTAPAIRDRLDEAGLNGVAGKGRDVWLGLGVASESPFVVVHDADALNYDTTHVSKLLAPLAMGYEFSKGYYARVEQQELFGRLFRLFYAPLLRALTESTDHEFLTYLDSFRYALAGEFAMTRDIARSIRAPRDWGLEVGTLGDTYELAGFEGTAQVDLGIHEHEHRSVEGAGGLGEMCAEVGETLFTVLEEQDVEIAFDTLQERYLAAADQLVTQYAGDASFNGFDYDPQQEREQVETYAAAIVSPVTDDRLPAWKNAPIDPATIEALSASSIADLR